VGAYRRGGAVVGWRREFNATAVCGRGSQDGGRRCPKALLGLCKSEGEVRVEPNWRNGEEGAWWRLSPQRGDGVSGAAEFPVRGSAPMVGAVRKATGGGGLPVGCFRGRTEEGKRTEARLRRAAPF
jgi:hypothetical protein